MQALWGIVSLSLLVSLPEHQYIFFIFWDFEGAFGMWNVIRFYSRKARIIWNAFLLSTSIAGISFCVGTSSFRLPWRKLAKNGLHLADARTLLISRTWTNFSDRAFIAAGPHVWNNLPMNLRQPECQTCRTGEGRAISCSVPAIWNSLSEYHRDSSPLIYVLRWYPETFFTPY